MFHPGRLGAWVNAGLHPLRSPAHQLWLELLGRQNGFLELLPSPCRKGPTLAGWIVRSRSASAPPSDEASRCHLARPRSGRKHGAPHRSDGADDHPSCRVPHCPGDACAPPTSSRSTLPPLAPQRRRASDRALQIHRIRVAISPDLQRSEHRI